MQREILNGVPYLVDANGKLYTWTADPATEAPICIGTYDSATKRHTLHPGVLEQLAPRIQEWRAKQQPRDRCPKPAAAENADADSVGGSD